MKVLVTAGMGKSRERNLDDVLTPQASPYEFSGSVEEALGMARKNSEMLGRLTAKLVEKGVLTLDEGKDVAGVYEHLVAVDGSVPPWDQSAFGL